MISSATDNGKLSQLQQDILDIVRIAQRNGSADMTADEIQKAYEERVTNKRVGDGPFAGRISEMAQAGLLLTSMTKRQSRLKNSGPRKNAYRVPSATGAGAGAGEARAVKAEASASFY